MSSPSFQERVHIITIGRKMFHSCFCYHFELRTKIPPENLKCWVGNKRSKRWTPEGEVGKLYVLLYQANISSP
jgi:hypothetical protein